MRIRIRQWRQERRDRKKNAAYNRLHGVGAVVPARRSSGGSTFDGDDIGELIVDVALLIPRGVAWVIGQIFSD
jgi:hypothetical protein